MNLFNSILNLCYDGIEANSIISSEQIKQSLHEYETQELLERKGIPGSHRFHQQDY